MENLCACEILWLHRLTVNKSQSCQLALTMSPMISLATASFSTCKSWTEDVGWCNSWMVCGGLSGMHSLQGSSKGSNHRDSHLVNMVARTTNTWSTLKIDLTGHSYQTHHPGHQDNIHCKWVFVILLGKCCFHMLCSSVTGITSFCSCCRYYWFVMVPSTDIVPLSPCLLNACHMVHFAGWTNVSATPCGFFWPRTSCYAC